LTIKETCDFNSQLLGISNTLKPENVTLYENAEKDLVEVFDPVCKLLFSFRNNEQFIIKLIENVKRSKDIDDLVNFLGHFFYENILVQKPENEEILFLIYLLLEKEIERLNSPSVASFLDGSFIGRFLKSLTRRQDVKSYLSMILGDLILKMETSTENFLEVDPSRIYDLIKNKKFTDSFSNNVKVEKSKKLFENDRKLMLGDRLRKTTINIKKSGSLETISSASYLRSSSKLKSSDSFGNNFNFNKVVEVDIQNYDEISETIPEEEMNNQYLIDLNKNELLFRYESEEMPEMKEFCKFNLILDYRQLHRIEDDKNMFTNFKFLEHLSNYAPEAHKVLFIYKKNFEKIKFFIDKLFSNLIENDSIIPYVIKCICKMIDVLITKKFPKIGFHEKNSFIGEFLFGKLIMQLLTNPDYNGIYFYSVISMNTRKNLLNINQILKKISRAYFFESNKEMQFTIFNTYLIEIMPMIINLYKKILEVKLPIRVENYIKQSNTYKNSNYNYFDENQNI